MRTSPARRCAGLGSMTARTKHTHLAAPRVQERVEVTGSSALPVGGVGARRQSIAKATR